MFNLLSSSVPTPHGEGRLFAWFSYCIPILFIRLSKTPGTVKACPRGPARFPSDCLNLDRGRHLDYPTATGLQAFFFGKDTGNAPRLPRSERPGARIALNLKQMSLSRRPCFFSLGIKNFRAVAIRMYSNQR
jgi:hypothetical protein